MEKTNHFITQLDCIFTEVKAAYKNLVREHGKNDRLEVFNICADYGIDLNGSTIDCISIENDDVVFYYNENENDYEFFDNIGIHDTAYFIDVITEFINKTEKEKSMDILSNTPKTKVRKVCITKSDYEIYKYVIIREVNDEYWFYDFANNLLLATETALNLGNGRVIEIENVQGE